VSDEKKQRKIREQLRRVWHASGKYLWGTPAGKVVAGALLGLMLAPVLPPAAIGLLAEPVNQILDVLSEPPGAE
jgi:hypothetical protein